MLDSLGVQVVPVLCLPYLAKSAQQAVARCIVSYFPASFFAPAVVLWFPILVFVCLSVVNDIIV